MGGAPFDLVEHRLRVRAQHVPEPPGEPVAAAAPGSRQSAQHEIERAILAEVEDLVLAGEVVVEVGRGQVGRFRDVAHPALGEPAVAEDTRRGAEDAHTPSVATPGAAGRSRTAWHRRHRSQEPPSWSAKSA